jgi:hypothetical protein
VGFEKRVRDVVRPAPGHLCRAQTLEAIAARLPPRQSGRSSRTVNSSICRPRLPLRMLNSCPEAGAEARRATVAMCAALVRTGGAGQAHRAHARGGRSVGGDDLPHAENSGKNRSTGASTRCWRCCGHSSNARVFPPPCRGSAAPRGFEATGDSEMGKCRSPSVCFPVTPVRRTNRTCKHSRTPRSPNTEHKETGR